ncbi:MAG: zinc ABC transporter substrate-binding protein [Rhodocyclaceae bacterium]|jgi:zinc transport system substrate-binding protein|nr:zinc ABC transporter substrate-binding protein [Rhodocyclaceae bacterium]
MNARRRWWLLGLFSLLLAASSSVVRPAPLQVFVSILPQKYFVEHIGGERVAVSVMVGPGRSPATYEPTPSQLSRLAHAQAYFRTGVAFEKVWMARIGEINPAMRIVDMCRGIVLRQVDRPFEAVLAPDGEADPHVWTSPRLVKRMSANIRDALVELDPAHRTAYAANFDRFAAELDQLDADIDAALAGARQRSFMVFHPSWGYYADAYGLKQIAIETGGKEPGPRSLARTIEFGRREGVRVIFVQAQFSRRAAETIAQALGARVVAVDPLAEDYLDNMRAVTRQFAEAIR